MTDRFIDIIKFIDELVFPNSSDDPDPAISSCCKAETYDDGDYIRCGNCDEIVGE